MQNDSQFIFFRMKRTPKKKSGHWEKKKSSFFVEKSRKSAKLKIRTLFKKQKISNRKDCLHSFENVEHRRVPTLYHPMGGFPPPPTGGSPHPPFGFYSRNAPRNLTKWRPEYSHGKSFQFPFNSNGYDRSDSFPLDLKAI